MPYPGFELTHPRPIRSNAKHVETITYAKFEGGANRVYYRGFENSQWVTVSLDNRVSKKKTTNKQTRRTPLPRYTDYNRQPQRIAIHGNNGTFPVKLTVNYLQTWNQWLKI